MITIRCQCVEMYHADEGHAGRWFLCKSCNRTLQVQPQAPVPSHPLEPEVKKVETEVFPQYRADPLRRHPRRAKPATAYAVVCERFSASRSFFGGNQDL